VFHKAWDGARWLPSKTDWEDLGGKVLGAPAAVAWGPNRLDIFVIGTNRGIFHKAWNGARWLPSPTDWEFLGGDDFRGSPAVASWGRNRLDIFALDSGGTAFHKAWNGSAWLPSQTDWQALDGIQAQIGAASRPGVASWGRNRLDIFIVNNGEDAVSHKAWDGSKWIPVG
jgi:hypothetical protein